MSFFLVPVPAPTVQRCGVTNSHAFPTRNSISVSLSPYGKLSCKYLTHILNTLFITHSFFSSPSLSHQFVFGFTWKYEKSEYCQRERASERVSKNETTRERERGWNVWFPRKKTPVSVKSKIENYKGSELKPWLVVRSGPRQNIRTTTAASTRRRRRRTIRKTLALTLSSALLRWGERWGKGKRSVRCINDGKREKTEGERERSRAEQRSDERESERERSLERRKEVYERRLRVCV